MANDERPTPGMVVWFDLTVPHTEKIRDFYADVVGWEPEPVEMEDYDDYNMMAGGEAVAGICHPLGPNADLPAQWLAYVSVDDLDASLKRVDELGGRTVSGPTELGPDMRMAVIQDPAGAFVALYEDLGGDLEDEGWEDDD